MGGDEPSIYLTLSSWLTLQFSFYTQIHLWIEQPKMIEYYRPVEQLLELGLGMLVLEDTLSSFMGQSF